ncbi:hypothetical protein F5Y15DRAFT_340691 [Xylariaceae sp. FL0016]|nr:hypothetical protein F5Y15DRAFT_340691 [Xylariaceae sp. FL0016]
MSHNVLLTGASGYLGGTLLARWHAAKLPPHGKLFALVRNADQADAVKKLGAEPLTFDPKDEVAVRRGIVDNEISIVYYLIDFRLPDGQINMIKALAEVKARTGRAVHLLHTSGAKMFSNHAGSPTDRLLSDKDPELFNIMKDQKSPYSFMLEGANTNRVIVEEAERYGVQSYIFAPCIVYGKGEGFGNKISIQTVAIVRAARGAKRVYRVDDGKPTWPVCHVIDNTNMYLDLMRKILLDEHPSYGKNGIYLASSGSVAWDDLYAAMANALAERNIVTDASVTTADDNALEAMGKALDCPAALVPVMLGGCSTFTAERGPQDLGWKPLYEPEHILQDAGAEVELILENIRN